MAAMFTKYNTWLMDLTLRLFMSYKLHKSVLSGAYEEL